MLQNPLQLAPAVIVTRPDEQTRNQGIGNQATPRNFQKHFEAAKNILVVM